MYLDLAPAICEISYLEGEIQKTYNEMIGAVNAGKRLMDYGEYLDNCDAIGYDDYDMYYYGFESPQLEGVLSFISSAFTKITGIGSTIAKTALKIGSAAWKGVTAAGKYAYKFAKKGVTGAYSFVSKTIPTFAKKAYEWGKKAPITAPIRWAVSGTKWVGKQLYTGAKWLVTPKESKPATKTVIQPDGTIVQQPVYQPQPAVYQYASPQGAELPYAPYAPAVTDYGKAPIEDLINMFSQPAQYPIQTAPIENSAPPTLPYQTGSGMPVMPGSPEFPQEELPPGYEPEAAAPVEIPKWILPAGIALFGFILLTAKKTARRTV